MSQTSNRLAGPTTPVRFRQKADGGFCAECLTESIFTQGDTWDELRANVKEAVEAFYFDGPKPAGIRLHLVRDEMLALG